MKGYIRRFFCERGLVLFLRAMGFKRLTNKNMAGFESMATARAYQLVCLVEITDTSGFTAFRNTIEFEFLLP